MTTRPTIYIIADPVKGTAKINRGSLVSGMNHTVRIRNAQGDWIGGGDWRLTIKATRSGDPWAIASGFVIDSENPDLMSAGLDLFTQPIMAALVDQESVDIVWQLVDNTNRESYGPPVQGVIYNTAYRDGDTTPPVAVPSAIDISPLWKLRVTDAGQILVEQREEET